VGSSTGDDSRVEEVPDLGPVPKRLVVDDETVRQLVTEQFPQWSKLPIAPVRDGGWDNWTFQLGDQMLVRLPSAAEYALAVEKERRWLPQLARQLPLPIPAPLGNGVSGAGYPYSWSIYGWLDGKRASLGRIADPVRFAVDLADFLVSLRGIDATAGPQPGIHNWYRGATLRTYDETTRSSLAELVGHIDVDLAAEIWSATLAARWDGVDVWFHGDLSEGNLLLKDGQLAAVIDFGTCGVGDPACDLAIAWTLLTKFGRRAFRDRLGVDDAAWARGRGWALWKALGQYAGAFEDADSDDAAEALRVLNEIFAEYPSSLE
jgi:aminoglycoside phosphotransferase (APT) family kinase protein